MHHSFLPSLNIQDTDWLIQGRMCAKSILSWALHALMKYIAQVKSRRQGELRKDGVSRRMKAGFELGG